MSPERWTELAAVFGLGPVIAAPAYVARGSQGEIWRLARDPGDPWYTEVQPLPKWTARANEAEAAGLAWADRLRAAQGLIAALNAQVTQPAARGPGIVCHRDFNPDNVVPVASGDHLVVLDWENAGRLDPSLELGYALFTFCAGPGELSIPAFSAMLDSYAVASGIDPVLSEGMFATALAVHLNFLYAMTRLAITDPIHRDYAEREIAQSLDDYLPGLATLLDYVRDS